MAMQGTSRTRRDRPATGVRQPGIARAMYVVLSLLAVSAFAQPVFAGLILDGNEAWRDWHAINGMVLVPLLALVQVVLAVLLWRGGGPGWLAPASAGLLVAIVVQNLMGQTSLLAVHVPLGVAILGLTGTLLARTRNLTRPSTDLRG
jgi:hypothetical protein